MSDAGAVGDRPQDVERTHRRRGAPAPATVELLERYHGAMRAELEDLLTEIRPSSGQLTIAGDVERPTLDRRKALWDLAVKLGRELDGAADPAPAPGTAAASSPARRAPRLTPAQRRQLGALE